MVVEYAIKAVLPWRVSRWYTLYTSVNIALEVELFSKVYTFFGVYEITPLETLMTLYGISYGIRYGISYGIRY
jgi:hypothetical protein